MIIHQDLWRILIVWITFGHHNKINIPYISIVISIDTILPYYSFVFTVNYDK